MAERITPTGHYMLVKALPTEDVLTDGGLKLIDLTFIKVEVVEVPVIMPYEEIYAKGDMLLISANTGHLQQYNKENCLWVNAKGYPEGDIWAIVTEEKDSK